MQRRNFLTRVGAFFMASIMTVSTLSVPAFAGGDDGIDPKFIFTQSPQQVPTAGGEVTLTTSLPAGIELRGYSVGFDLTPALEAGCEVTSKLKNVLSGTSMSLSGKYEGNEKCPLVGGVLNTAQTYSAVTKCAEMTIKVPAGLEEGTTIKLMVVPAASVQDRNNEPYFQEGGSLYTGGDYPAFTIVIGDKEQEELDENDVAFEITGENSGALTVPTEGVYQYSTNGADWTEITEFPTILDNLTEGTAIQVVKKGGEDTLDSDPYTITVGKETEPDFEYESCTTFANNDGKITGVDDTMEYRKDGGTWEPITGDMTDLEPGTYEVRTKANGWKLASDPVSVTIEKYTGTKAETPTAADVTFAATGDKTGTLTVVDGEPSDYKYSTDGGKTWKDITESPVEMTDLNKVDTIQVVKKGDGETIGNSDPYEIEISSAEKPGDVVATNCTTVQNNDGTITGVNDTMEYRKDGGTWEPITGDMTDLKPGTYEVRTKANGQKLASAPASVTIKKYKNEEDLSGAEFIFTQSEDPVYTTTGGEVTLTTSLPAGVPLRGYAVGFDLTSALDDYGCEVTSKLKNVLPLPDDDSLVLSKQYNRDPNCPFVGAVLHSTQTYSEDIKCAEMTIKVPAGLAAGTKIEFKVVPAAEVENNGVSYFDESNGLYADGDYVAFTIEIEKKPEETPEVTFAATDSDTGTLTLDPAPTEDEPCAYRIIPEGTDPEDAEEIGWVDITESPVTVTDLKKGDTIQVIKKGDDETTVDSEPWEITVEQADAPTEVAKENDCTTLSNNDGKIIGVDSTMEYHKNVAEEDDDYDDWMDADGNPIWEDVEADSITDLTPGEYAVRVKADGEILASESATVTIEAVTKISVMKYDANRNDTVDITDAVYGVDILNWVLVGNTPEEEKLIRYVFDEGYENGEGTDVDITDLVHMVDQLNYIEENYYIDIEAAYAECYDSLFA